MATLQKFRIFVQDLAHGVHDFENDELRILLTNTLPSVDDEVTADLTEIASGNGYTAGGNEAILDSSGQTDGVYYLLLNDPQAWDASGSGFGPFRYCVLYNLTTTKKTQPLIGYWDYGSEVTLLDGESFSIDLDGIVGVFTIT